VSASPNPVSGPICLLCSPGEGPGSHRVIFPGIGGGQAATAKALSQKQPTASSGPPEPGCGGSGVTYKIGRGWRSLGLVGL
jgi:hypothetical protein